MRLKSSWDRMQGSPTLTAELIRILGAKERIEEAKGVFSVFKESTQAPFVPYATNVLLDVLLIARRDNEAKELLEQLPEYIEGKDALDSAILAKRMNRNEAAHRYFERAGELVFGDARTLHEFAQAKMKLAQKAFRQGGKKRFARETNSRLLKESKELLERVIQMDADRTRHAWAWRDFGRAKKWLGFPRDEVKNAYERAIELLPDEQRFKDEMKRWQLSFAHDKPRS